MYVKAGLGQVHVAPSATPVLQAAIMPDIAKMFCIANPTHEACQSAAPTVKMVSFTTTTTPTTSTAPITSQETPPSALPAPPTTQTDAPMPGYPAYTTTPYTYPMTVPEEKSNLPLLIGLAAAGALLLTKLF